MRALVFVCNIKVKRSLIAHATEVVLVNTWARSRAKAVELDLLVAYLVIDICD